MKFIAFALVYPIIWMLSKLPFRILYIISDCLFLILYYIIGYRKDVVLNNLKITFPEKSDEEIKKIRKKFFQHLTDLIIESIKLSSFTEQQMLEHYHYKNPDILNELHKKGLSVALTGSHHNNWEWVVGMPLITDYNCFAAYTKIKNKHVNKLIKDTRSRFGTIPIKTTDFTKKVIENAKNKVPSLYVLLSDQSPLLSRTRHWTTFLNTYLPVHTGAEILSKKNNFAVVNMNVLKVKRGFYHVEFELITDSPNKLNKFEITEKYHATTEAQIRKQPENYLWSHKRFKHVGKFSEWEKTYKR